MGGGILRPVRRARPRPSLLPLALLLSLPLRAQPLPAPPPAEGPTPPIAAGVELAVPVERRAGGPLFAIEPLVERLGGELAPAEGGEGWVLSVAGKEILFGPGSDVLVIDREIIRLSQAPEAGLAGLLVPLDFLRATFGDFSGYRFAWDAVRGQLTVERGAGREVPVTIDVVHIQGLTTVVFQFSEAPRYRIVEVAGGVDVRLLGDRLAPSPGWRQQDPLVAGIDLERDRIHIALVPGAAADSYVLDSPFRLVFDVHRGRSPSPPRLPRAALPPRETEGVRTIVLDPGHGGNEIGATGASGVEEKELTLILAQSLKASLERRLPVRVILTRSEDAYLPLETRAAIANQNKADLFVSLHLNSVARTGTRAHGAETYFLSMQASDARAAEAAELENRSGRAGGGDDPLHDLQLILWDLAQSHHLAESQRVASLIQEELNGALDLANRGVKQAPFQVLMGAAMPAVLVELGFLSNPEEERRLLDAGYRAELTAALVRAVGRYKAEVDSRAALRPTVSTASDGGVGN